MIDYCQFTMPSLMECYEIVGGLKSNCINKNVKSQDALTISPNRRSQKVSNCYRKFSKREFYQ